MNENKFSTPEIEGVCKELNMNEDEYHLSNIAEGGAAQDIIDKYDAIQEPATPVAHTVKRGRGRPAKVDKQIFIDAWNNAQDLNEVALMLGMPTTSASVKASQLRKKGCELKQFRRGRKHKTAI